MLLGRFGAPWGLSTRFRGSIVLRLLAATLLFSSVVTVGLTALQLWLRYDRGLGVINGRLEDISRSYLASLGEGLWRLDEQQLQLQLDGILRLSDIRAAEIREILSSSTPVVVTAGHRASEAVISREYPVFHDIRGVERQIGTFYIEATLTDLYSELTDTALVILVSQGAKTFLVSFFSMYIFFHLLTRHLIALANSVGSYDVREPPPPCRLDRRPPREPDELDKVVVAFNDVCANLQAAYREAQGAIQALRESEERLRLALDSERAARAAAEFLSEAGALLSESLDHEETLARLGRLCVRSLADTCVLDLVEGQGIRRVARACADASKGPLLEQLERCHPARWDSPHPAAQCLRSGKAILAPDITDEFLRRSCEDEEHLELVRAIGTRSAVIVPLVARGQVLGVFTLGSGTPGRYGRTDLELAQELAHRAAIAIDNARLHRETQLAVRVRDEFLLVASHELRTPMTSLTISLKTLQRAERSGRSANAAEVSQSVELASRQGTRLNRLIGDILDISRIETRSLSLERTQVELGAIVRDVAQRFEADLAAARCPLSIRCEGPVVGRWDPSRVDQVVTNLLANAVKFGPGEPVEIHLGEEAGLARLSVHDHGIGIDPSHQARIFDRFERAVPVRHYGGLGLGLYISRRIVEAHGGSIRVESRPGAGSTFTVELPCAWSAGTAPSREAEAGAEQPHAHRTPAAATEGRAVLARLGEEFRGADMEG
jgi:signal transduction histidine kinase